MGLAVNVGSMILAARQLTACETLDQANSFATDAELLVIASGEAQELDDLITQNADDDYNRGVWPIALLPNVSIYPLSADFYKVLSVDILWSPNITRSAKRFTEAERNRFRSNIGVSWTSFGKVYYRTLGSNIEFMPTPLSAVSVNVNYAPVTPMFSDIVHDTYESNNGWHWAIIYGIAAYLASKDANPELEASLLAKKAAVQQRVREMAASRNDGEPPRVQQTRRHWEDDC